MKSQDIHLEDIIDFSEGVLNLKGRRLILHDIHAFAHLRKDLIDMVGIKQARQIFTRFGYFWGQADAAAVKRIFNINKLEEWIKAGTRMHTLQGAAKVKIKSLSLDKENNCFDMQILWYRSGEAEEHLISMGKSSSPVCWILVGYASGYVSFCLDKKIYFIEKSCRAQGDKICYAVGKDAQSWGEELNEHIDYFNSDDIPNKILTLSSKLKEKTRQLILQQKRIERLEKKAKIFHVEIRSKSFSDILDLSHRAAQFDSSVLITGETGVGKEMLARHIHKLSLRAREPFIAVNCGALPESLAESELFGHKAGSFTGATQNRIGLFEHASNGTILLDEIGDLPQSIQVKILRVLQEREIVRVGETIPRKVNVRIIAATNKNLEEEVEQENFRNDLYYRLNVIEIKIPSLRERKEDIIPLSRFFIKKVSRKLKLDKLTIDPSCFSYLLSYPWPGNVRELENALERAAVLSSNSIVLPDNLPQNITHTDSVSKLISDPLHCTLKQAETEHIKNVMHLVKNNKTKAAKALDISPSTLWRKLKEYDI